MSNTDLRALLANNAPAIARLVRAAEEVQKDGGRSNLIWFDLVEALAALNAEDKP